MKRIFILALLLGTLFASANHDELTFTEQEQAWINKKIPITYVYDTDWAPFEWKNEVNRHTGIIPEILNIIARKSHLRFEAIHTNSWSKAVLLAENDKVDMYSAIPYDESRAKYMNFTSHDIFQYNACFVKRSADKSTYVDLEKELIGKRVAIVKSSSLGNTVKQKFPQATYIDVDKTEEGFSQLAKAEIDLLVINSATADYMINRKGYEGLEIAKKIDQIFRLKIAISKSMPDELLSIIDKSLADIDKSEIHEIYNKWTLPLKSPGNIDWHTIIYFICAFLIVVLFVGYRQYLLHQTNKELAKLASFDYMTKLYNRRFFTQTCDELLHLAKRSGTTSSVLMLDIDKFKNINDTYGHKTGDDVLVSLASVLKGHSRKSDIICRWGGEEFVMFLPDTNSEGASTIAENIRSVIEKSAMILENNQTLKYTVSIGVASIGDHLDLNIEDAVFKADKALYMAKENGRNNVCVN